MADERVICGVCGGELEGPWVRFHYAKPHTDPENPGHYVDGGSRDLTVGPGDVQEGEGMAPPAPERPKVPGALKKLLVPLEEDVRWDLISWMRMAGYTVHNMEQGYRPGGGHTRVGKGVPDVYFQGHGCSGWVELKRPDGKPAREKQTAEQKAFERDELANGGIYLLVESTAQVQEWHRNRLEELSQVELI